MLWGYKKYEIIGSGYEKLYKKIIDENISPWDMAEKNGILHLKLSREFCGGFEKICKEQGYEYNVTNEKGLFKKLKEIKKRPGLITGFIVTVILLSYFSNVAVDIRILCDDKATKEKIRQALFSEGIKAGCYIPNINYSVAERNIRSKVDEISWAGITRKGSVLFIDVVNNIPQVKSVKTRLPSNLIACEDAVIDKMEIKDGQVKYCKGSGVTKGDVIVSGKIITKKSTWEDGKEKIDTKINYTRATGKVYGTFERKISFTQNFQTQKETYTGNEKKLTYFNFFSADIPLFRNMPQGFYKTKSRTKTLELFGIETPLKITKYSLEEYDFQTVTLDENSAKELLGEKFYKYEKNFLKDYLIKDRKVTTKKDKNGITQTVSYTLYGVISREMEFFIAK